MKNNIFKYILPPLVFVILLWVTSFAFELMSAPSDLKVGIGITILIIILAIIIKFFVSIFKNKI